MRLHRLSCFGFTALVLGLAPACNGGQTGDLSGNNDGDGLEGSANGCVEHKEELADFDEETDAGSAEELLSYAERTFDAPIVWKQSTDRQSWSLSPESGEGSLHIAVTRGAKAYRLTYTQREDESHQELSARICPPSRLGVEASVSVTTDGGALAESFDTLLRSDTAGVATLSVPLDLAKISGELSASSSDADAKLVQVALEAVLTSAGTTGSIAGMEEVTHGTGPDGVSSASPAELAVWPGGAACEAASPQGDGLDVALVDEVLGATGEASVGEVTPAAPVTITWLGGEATKLSVSIESSGAGCFRVSDSPVPQDAGPLVTYPVTIGLESDDGRLSGGYAGTVEVRGTGEDRRVTAAVNISVAVAELDSLGFSSVSVPNGTETVMLQLETRAAPGSRSGSVTLFAMSASPCAAESSSSGSNGAAPCAGSMITRVETASWSF